MDNQNNSISLQVRESAFNKRIHTFAILNNTHIDVRQFLEESSILFKSELQKTIDKHNMVKVMAILCAEFEKRVMVNVDDAHSDEQVVKETLYFPTDNFTLGLGSNLNEIYRTSVIETILESVENTAIRGSGFALSQIKSLDVQVSLYKPLGASSYVKTPKGLRSRRAIVNVKNDDDNMCFKWAILSALYPRTKNPQRIQNYRQYEDELNFDSIEFPVKLTDIDKFVKQNSEISINVYIYEDKCDRITPLRVSSEIKKHHIHLLMITKQGYSYFPRCEDRTTAGYIRGAIENEYLDTHYCWIKDLSRCVNRQLSKHEHKTYICDRCLNCFSTMDRLDRHSINCMNECKIEMPSDDMNWLYFKNHEYQLKAPFIIYADTEAFLRVIDVEEQRRIFGSKQVDGEEIRNTEAIQEHHVFSVGYYFKCKFDDSKSFYAHSGDSEDCIGWFMNELTMLAQAAAEMLEINVPMDKLTDEQERTFSDPNAICFICKQPFEGKKLKRVRDHCHYTGTYRGVSHNECNLMYQESRTIPVVMHNLSGYDAHMLIRKLATDITGELSIIPNNNEQYISFTKTVWESTCDRDIREKIKLKFIDSTRFMPDSLANLASLIPSEKKRILYSECGKYYSPEQISMLERKGVFPYDYVDSYERLYETALPTRNDFYSKLYEEHISADEYKFACNVWNKFDIKTLREYSDLYLKTDVLLLADVFEQFRETCLDIYKLDPAHYYTSPGLSFDAMLKYTNIQIELLTDIEMLLFVENGIRGGITHCSKRYAKANNKYMGNDYKPNEADNYLMYLDGELNYRIMN